MARPGSECCRLQGAGGSFWAQNRVVVVVDVVVGVVDGGCACVARGDVAALGKALVCLTSVWVAVSAVWGVA